MGINVGGYEINNTIAKSFEYNDIVQNGLVLNLNAVSPSSYPGSGNSWYDISTYTNNGTLTNGPYYVSTNGGGIYFAGDNDYINIPHNDSLVMTTQMSINVWFSIPQNGLPERQSLVCKHYRAYELGIYPGGYIHTYTRNGTGGGNYDEGTNAYHPDGEWQANRIYNVTWTLNAQTEKTYFESVIASNGGTYTKGNANTGDEGVDLQIGIRLSSGLIFKGTIYSVQIYNIALSATEILHNYNIQKGRFGL
jgi:hypothetical protein